MYPKLPLRIDVNIANYCRYFDNNFIDISRNIHCVLNDINKIILAQKLETFLTNILSRDIFVIANKKECEKIVKKMGNTNISNTVGYLIVAKNYQYYFGGIKYF